MDGDKLVHSHFFDSFYRESSSPESGQLRSIGNAAARPNQVSDETAVESPGRMTIWGLGISF